MDSGVRELGANEGLPPPRAAAAAGEGGHRGPRQSPPRSVEVSFRRFCALAFAALILQGVVLDAHTHTSLQDPPCLRSAYFTMGLRSTVASHLPASPPSSSCWAYPQTAPSLQTPPPFPLPRWRRGRGAGTPGVLIWPERAGAWLFVSDVDSRCVVHVWQLVACFVESVCSGATFLSSELTFLCSLKLTFLCSLKLTFLSLKLTLLSLQLTGATASMSAQLEYRGPVS